MADWTEFAEYVGARRDTWVRAAFLLVGDRDQAEDLVQTALIRVWPHWPRVSERGDPDAYIRKVIFHQFSSHLRRGRWRELSTDLRPGMWAGPQDRIAEPDATSVVDARLHLREALAELGPRQRAVLVLRYYLDLSEVETASVLGCSVGTVKSQAAKALKRLRPAAVAQSDRLGETTAKEGRQ